MEKETKIEKIIAEYLGWSEEEINEILKPFFEELSRHYKETGKVFKLSNVIELQKKLDNQEKINKILLLLLEVMSEKQ